MEEKSNGTSVVWCYRIEQRDDWVGWCSAVLPPQGGSPVPLDRGREGRKQRGRPGVVPGTALYPLLGLGCNNESGRRRKTSFIIKNTHLTISLDLPPLTGSL